VYTLSLFWFRVNLCCYLQFVGCFFGALFLETVFDSCFFFSVIFSLLVVSLGFFLESAFDSWFFSPILLPRKFLLSPVFPSSFLVFCDLCSYSQWINLVTPNPLPPQKGNFLCTIPLFLNLTQPISSTLAPPILVNLPQFPRTMLDLPHQDLLLPHPRLLFPPSTTKGMTLPLMETNNNKLIPLLVQNININRVQAQCQASLYTLKKLSKKVSIPAKRVYWEKSYQKNIFMLMLSNKVWLVSGMTQQG